jgi:type I restriction enzyme S subunit
MADTLSKVRLLDVCDFISGNAHEQHISPLGQYTVINSKFVSTEGKVAKFAIENFCPANKDDITLVMSDLPNGKALGKCFLVPEDKKYAVNQRVCILRSKGFDPKYLFYILNRNPYFLSFNDGVSQTHLLNSVFEKCYISITEDIAEQKAIAEALSDIDELIENIKMELQKKRNFRIAIAQELLSKAKGSNIKLGEYAEFSKGINLPKSALSETGSSKAIHYGELFTHYPEKIKQIKSRTNPNSLPVVLSRANDVLMPTSDVTPNGLATASCISEEGVVLGGDILIVRTDPNLVDGTYLSYVIRNSKDKVLKLVNGTTVYHLYGKDLSNFEFILPSISYQREAVDVLEILGEEISLLDAELVKYECIKQGMAHDLLTGKVRLV